MSISSNFLLNFRSIYGTGLRLGLGLVLKFTKFKFTNLNNICQLSWSMTICVDLHCLGRPPPHQSLSPNSITPTFNEVDRLWRSTFGIHDFHQNFSDAESPAFPVLCHELNSIRKNNRFVADFVATISPSEDHSELWRELSQCCEIAYKQFHGITHDETVLQLIMYHLLQKLRQERQVWHGPITF